jgi:hypothetical protein
MTAKHPYSGFRPFEHVQKASDDGYYIEAIAMASMWIEAVLMEMIGRRIQRGARKAGLNDANQMKKFIDNFHNLTASQGLRWALALELMNYDLYKDINAFLKERNHVVHNRRVLKMMSGDELKALSECGMKCFEKLFSRLH